MNTSTPRINLRRALAQHGFESNDDYEFALRCLFEAELSHLRVLHIDGTAGRRKTAFATALARALEYPHILYHDFTRTEPQAPVVVVPETDEETGPLEPPMSAFERVVTEACAYSEAARTVLVLDQLQAADFADHIRLHRFADTGEWSHGSATVVANPRNLLVALISEQPLYHSLARIGFRIFTDAQRAFLDYRPQDYGLGDDALPLFSALSALFSAADLSPTPGEFSRLLDDLLKRVRSEEHLRQSLFGRIENVDRPRLYAPEIHPALGGVIDALNEYLGHDEIKLGS
jgi:hypothetical protein